MARVVKRKLGWYAVLDVPRTLQKAMGKKQLVQSLETRIWVEAIGRSRRAFADLQAILDAALRPPGEAIMGEADLWRDSIAAARRGERAVIGLEQDDGD